MRRDPGPVDVSSDLQVASPQLTLDIDRDRASALGVSAGQVEDALYSAFGARQVSTIFTPTNDYQVIMELLPQYQRDPNASQSALHPLVRRQAGSDRRRDHAAQYRGSLAGHALWAVAVGHILLQYGSRRIARRRGDARQEEARGSFCRPPSAPSSRARPRRSSPRSTAWACCW